MGRLVYLKDVATIELDPEKCVGCEMCVIVCPHHVLAMNNGHAEIEQRDACIECGACAMNCPADAVRVQAGVGCAAAVINNALGRDSSSCCCTIENYRGPGEPVSTERGRRTSSCC